MRHQESSIQIACITEFRLRYPWASKLLIHVKNEESGGRVAGAIHKAEGVVAGASDLLLLIPSAFDDKYCAYLSIEMKSEKGRLRGSQLVFGAYVESASGAFRISRSVENFMALVTEYMNGVPPRLVASLKEAYQAEEAEHIRKAREELKAASAAKPRRRRSVTTARDELARIIGR